MIKLSIAHKKFIDHLEGMNRASATVIAYGKDIEQLLEHASRTGADLVNDVTLEHLESFMKNLLDEGYTAKSISRKTNSTKTFFKYLLDEGHVERDPAELLKHPKVEVKAPRILSKLEYRALRDAVKDDIRTATIIEVLLQTGLSISELAGIELADLHLEGDSPYLSVPTRNSREARNVPLNKVVIDAIKKYVDEVRPTGNESPYLFITKTGNPLLVRNIRSTIDRYFRHAGIESAKVNDLRHTFAAHHLVQGTSLVYISKILGHKRVSTTERYLEYIEREVEEEKHELGVL